MATKVVSRENVETWPADSQNLYLFRRAVEEMQAISAASLGDERGYQWVAGVHGGFGGQPFCHHGDSHFVTWHRPYVLDIELKLRDQIRRIATPQAADEWRLPYWDWADPNTQGIPAAFTEKDYLDPATGKRKPNPLLRQPYMLPPDPREPITSRKFTFRDPGSLDDLRRLRGMVESALEEPSFSIFSQAIENPHNQLHGWAGGFMQTFRSSFDPIFWVHHCNIDRQFWMWTQRFTDASIPAWVRNYPCQPFNFQDIRAGAFFDTRALGYTYAESRAVVNRSQVLEELASLESMQPAGAKKVKPPLTLSVEFARIATEFKKARVHFNGLHHTEKTYEIRLYSGKDPRAFDAKTPKDQKAGFIGSYVILGHGSCPGAPGHCDAKATPGNGLRQPHHLAPFDMFVDVTGGLHEAVAAWTKKAAKEAVPVAKGKAKAKAKAGKAETTEKPTAADGAVALSIVVLDMKGKQVPHEVLQFDSLSLTAV